MATFSLERPRLSRPFLKGPVSLAWLALAARSGTRALHVAILCRFRWDCARNRTARFSMRLAAEFGLNRHSVYRALKQLESTGLIRVDRQRGRCPVVTEVVKSDDCR